MPQPADEPGGRLERAGGPEDVEVGTLEHHTDAVLGEPPRLGAVQVVNGSARSHMGADAAERGEEGCEVRR